MVRPQSSLVRSLLIPWLAVLALSDCGGVDAPESEIEHTATQETGGSGFGKASEGETGGSGFGTVGEGETGVSGGSEGEMGGAADSGEAGPLLEEWGLGPEAPYVEPEGVFELVDSRGDVPDFPRPIELRLLDGGVTFRGGCNDHDGEYSFDGQTLRASRSWGSTLAQCDAPRMLVDHFLYAFLTNAPRAGWSGERLVLATSDAALVFELTEVAHPDWPLFGTYWDIRGWTDTTEELATTHELYGNLVLRDGELGGWADCAYIDGTYEETQEGFLIQSFTLKDEECQEENSPSPREFLTEFFAPGEVTARIVDRHLYLTRDGRELHCPPPR